MDKRRIIGISVLALAFVLALILVFSGNDNSLGNKEKKENKISGVSPFKLQEGSGQIGSNLNLFQINENSGINLTDDFGKKLAEGFSLKNPGGFDAEGGLNAPSANELMVKSAEDYAKKLQASGQTFELKDLKIGSDDSATAAADYFTAFQSIAQKYNDKMRVLDNLSAFSETLNSEFLLPVINEFGKMIEEMKNLTVPPSFASLHKEALNLYSVEKFIFVSMANYSNDPLQATAAAENFENLGISFNNLMLNFQNKLTSKGVQVKQQ